MKLSHKLLIFMGLSWLVFIATAYFHVVRDSYPALVLISFLITLATYLLIKSTFINRIKKVNREIAKIINSNDITQRVKAEANDEISINTRLINTLLEIIQVSRSKQDDHSGLKLIKPDNVYPKQTTSNITPLPQNDHVTSLPTRAFFNEVLNKAMNHAKRHKKILAILLIDIDSFKNINAQTDIETGNKVLKEIAARLATTLRSDDVIARLDGDEFIVLLNDINKPKFASAVAEKLLQACSQPLVINSNNFSLTASIGICIYPSDGDSLEDILKNADMALYKAKHSGGNSYQFHTNEMNEEAREYIKLESSLRKAIKENEFVLYYQPKLNLKRGNYFGIEALVRWPQSDLSFISPAQFIPLAEETGMITELGEWAIREACRTNKSWQDEGYEHLTVAINLSPKQFYHPNIVSTISNILNETGLNPKYLEIEITEKTAMDNTELTTEILGKLKEIGVQLSIDHFGTGYTSISHLKQFPISAIKIDQTFIKGLPNIPDDMAITNAFIALAHHLGLEIVAEGVETAEQVQYLSAQDCDMIQGYYLSHPLPANKIILQFKKLTDEVF